MAKSHLAWTVAAFLIPLPLEARELLGADAFLREISAEPANPDPSDNSPESLRKRFESFEVDAAKLPPEEAASRWLDLFDAIATIPPATRREEGYDTFGLTFAGLIKILPPATAWNSLGAEINSRTAGKKSAKDTSLALLGSLLGQDPARITAALAQLEASPPEENVFSNGSNFEAISTIRKSIDLMAGRKSSPEETLTRQLEEIEKAASIGNNTYNSIDIPALPDTPETSSLLLRALMTGAYLYISDPSTKKLALEVTVKNSPKIPAAPWWLIRTPEDISYYPFFAHEFRARGNDDRSFRQAADRIFFLHLVAEGKKTEALAMLNDVKNREMFEYIYSLEGNYSPEQKERIFTFFIDLITKEPDRDFWSFTADVADTPERKKTFIDLVSRSIADPRITNETIRTYIENYQLSHLFSSDRTDDALAFLESLVRKYRAATAATPHDEIYERLDNLLTRSITIGELLERPDIVSANLDILIASLDERLAVLPDNHIIKLLCRHQRFPEAEKLLLSPLARIIRSRFLANKRDDVSAAFVQLAYVYYKADRHQDVIRLVENNPYWIADDLSKVEAYSKTEPSFPIIVARSLAKSGRTGEAAEIARWSITGNPGKDEGYETLIEIASIEEFTAFLDSTFAANPFEERPLIWKAQLLNDTYHFREAEQVIRQAISIDPSDGEQGKGDRMRAYAVLGSILKGLRDEKQASEMDRIIHAIRTSEKADDWWHADVPSIAIKLYEEALESFSDAYCIQSRLALRYASSGDSEKAALHYQRAFELMPDSFGRIESHCFGCEGVFKDEISQKLAEIVFTEVAAKPNPKPQIFYLLGYLRQEQGRREEAAEFFRKATAMDPDYVNAWNKLAELADSVPMSPSHRDDIALALIRLNRAPSLNIQAANLGKLWDALLAREKDHPIPDERPVFPLKTAREYLRTNPPAYVPQPTRPTSPRSILGSQPIVRATIDLIDRTYTAP